MPTNSQQDEVKKVWALMSRLQDRMLAELDPEVDHHSSAARRAIKRRLDEVMPEENHDDIVLNDKLIAGLLDWIVTLTDSGPLTPLLADDTISDVMVNTPQDIYVEKSGQRKRSEVSFKDQGHLRDVLNRMLAPVGKQLDDAHPLVEARLPSMPGLLHETVVPGHLTLSAAIDPVSLLGPTVVIGKWTRVPLTAQNLIDFGSVSIYIMEFLRAAVIAGANIVLCGDDKSGTTTWLNVLAGFIPADERVVTIEQFPELRLRQEDVIPMVMRQRASQSLSELAALDLVKFALRLRADRLILGDCLGDEALDFLHAAGIGWDGLMTTVHARSARDALARLEAMISKAAPDVSTRSVRELIASGVDLMVQVERLNDGTRKVTAVSELQVTKGGAIKLADIFTFKQTGVEGRRKIIGSFRPTGVYPNILTSIGDSGVQLPPDIFEA